MSRLVTALVLGLSAPALCDPTVLKARAAKHSIYKEHQKVAALHAQVLELGPSEKTAGMKLSKMFQSKILDDAAAGDVPTIESKYGMPIVGEWLVDMYFDKDMSTPYPLILDSGSANTAVAVKRCANCEGASTELDLKAASPHKCTGVSYGDESWWKGDELERTFVAFSEDLKAEAALAGITSQGDFFTNSSYYGILGTAYKGLATKYQATKCAFDDNRARQKHNAPNNPILYALKTQGAIDANVHSLAVCGDEGTVSMGGVADDMYSGAVRWVGNNKLFNLDEMPYQFFQLYVDDVVINKVSANLTFWNNYWGGMIIDTGTTLNYFTYDLYSHAREQVEAAVSWVGDGFFNMDKCAKPSALHAFPDITITFATPTGAAAMWNKDIDDDGSRDVKGRYNLVLKPEQYLFELDNCHYWGIYPTFALSILGNIAMKDRTVVFDIDNDRVGFARGNCKKSWKPGPYVGSEPWQPSPWKPKPYEPEDHSAAGR